MTIREIEDIANSSTARDRAWAWAWAWAWACDWACDWALAWARIRYIANNLTRQQ